MTEERGFRRGIGLPQVYREREFSFRIYYNEGNEPPHVHIRRGGDAAKFWLVPRVSLYNSAGFNTAELRWMREVIVSKITFFMDQWHATQNRQK